MRQHIMMTPHHSSYSGMTLTEVLAAAVVMAVIAAGTLMALVTAGRIAGQTSGADQYTLQAQESMERYRNTTGCQPAGASGTWWYNASCTGSNPTPDGYTGPTLGTWTTDGTGRQYRVTDCPRAGSPALTPPCKKIEVSVTWTPPS